MMLLCSSIHDVIESFMLTEINMESGQAIIEECGRFLKSKGLDEKLVTSFFSIQFTVSSDQSYIDIKGGNLMSTLWIIDVFPPDPEKYIFETICNFDGKTYIYVPRTKALKIKRNAKGGKKATN